MRLNFLLLLLSIILQSLSLILIIILHFPFPITLLFYTFISLLCARLHVLRAAVPFVWASWWTVLIIVELPFCWFRESLHIEHSKEAPLTSQNRRAHYPKSEFLWIIRILHVISYFDRHPMSDHLLLHFELSLSSIFIPWWLIC